MNSPFAFFALFSLTYVARSSAKLFCSFENVNVDTIRCSNLAVGVNFLDEDQEVHGLDENAHPREMVAANCRLSSVNGEFFKNMNEINRLDLSNNLIDVLTTDMFKHIQKLRYLNLAKNWMETIDSSIFFALKNLRVLDISDNLLSDSNRIFNGFERLTILYMSNNRYVRVFPSQSNRVTLKNTLKTLHITNTSLSFPDVFNVNFPNLLNLDLSHNSKLYPDKNAIGTLKNCTKLVSFRMTNCRLESIDENYFRNLIDIVIIDISHNNLVELSANQFSANSKLNHLDISNNIIGMLNAFIFRSNSKLSSLKMAKNKFKSLPEKIFDSLVDLEYLDLGYNEIETIPTMLFSKTRKLDVLLLDNNKIKTIHENTFVSVISLTKLLLSSNSIKNFNYKIVSPIKRLIELNLDNNHLTDISKEFFDNENYLLILNVSCNMVVDLEPPANSYLSTKIIIHGNPLNCNCLNSLFRHQDLQFSLDWPRQGQHPSCIVSNSGVCDKNINEADLIEWKRQLNYYPGLCRFRV